MEYTFIAILGILCLLTSSIEAQGDERSWPERDCGDSGCQETREATEDVNDYYGGRFHNHVKYAAGAGSGILVTAIIMTCLCLAWRRHKLARETARSANARRAMVLATSDPERFDQPPAYSDIPTAKETPPYSDYTVDSDRKPLC